MPHITNASVEVYYPVVILMKDLEEDVVLLQYTTVIHVIKKLQIMVVLNTFLITDIEFDSLIVNIIFKKLI